MLHNFKNNLKHEKEQADRADKFYREVLHASEITRYNHDNEQDMIMQRKDIDCSFSINNVHYMISEKFRDKDFGDFYVEFYSKYPNTPGWIFTGSANAILYFTPENVYWVTFKSLKTFCVDQLFTTIPQCWFSDIYISHKPIKTRYLLLDKTRIPLNIIQAHNQCGECWETIGISISFEILEKFGVKFRRYKLNSVDIR
ncbi:MAG: hypothetical protein PHH37_14645 [Paludibacter sp.]|nr:hypothetical protein [Paludibacter sp.]